MDRVEFRSIKQKRGLFTCRTSGSTGEPVMVEKYQAQVENLKAHVKLFSEWHNWDPNALILKLGPIYRNTIVRNNITYANKYTPGLWTQLISYPSLLPYDLFAFNKITTYGEAWTGIGIDIYTTEEFGCIAIQCPHNPYALHIMSNLEIKFLGHTMSITDLSHPYLKDYEIGDCAELVNCNCGINLPAMTHVKGRIRNMMQMPDGSTQWPIFGLMYFPEIERFQVFQETLTKLRLHIRGRVSEIALAAMRKSLGYDFEIEVIQGNFKPGKHEEFICEI